MITRGQVVHFLGTSRYELPWVCLFVCQQRTSLSSTWQIFLRAPPKSPWFLLRGQHRPYLLHINIGLFPPPHRRSSTCPSYPEIVGTSKRLGHLGLIVHLHVLRSLGLPIVTAFELLRPTVLEPFRCHNNRPVSPQEFVSHRGAIATAFPEI